MNFFKTDRLKDGFKSLTNDIKKFANDAKAALNKKDDKDKQDIVMIFPRIYWITFPRAEKIKDLSEKVKKKFNNKFFIWNVSEYQYDHTFFNGQVSDHIFVGYPCPPFQEIMRICKAILEWLIKDQENTAIIHCQSTKCRSAVVTSCLLSLLKVVNHPMEALTYFCNKLNLDDTSFLYPSQHMTIKHFANVIDGIQLNKKAYVLEKILINEVPKLLDEKDKKSKSSDKSEGFRPYIQIFKGSKAIFNYLSKEKPKVYYPTDIAIWFDVGLEITDDILIRCRHYKNDTERTSVFRVFFNPGFAFDEVIRLNKTEVDFLPDVETTEGFLIDLIIKPTEGTNNEADGIGKLREECLKLSTEYIEKKKEYDRQQEEIKREHERQLQLQIQQKEAAEKAAEAAKNTATSEVVVNKEAEKKDVSPAETTKAKFVIDENPLPDEEEKDEEKEDEKDEEALKALHETPVKEKENEEKADQDESPKKEEAEPVQAKVEKNEKIEKLLNKIENEDEEEEEEEEEDDLDDYISKLEQKTG